MTKVQNYSSIQNIFIFSTTFSTALRSRCSSVFTLHTGPQKNIFIFLAEVRPFLAQIESAAHPASYSVSTGRISLEVKRPVPEAALCPPSSADLSYASPQSYGCMARCLISTRQTLLQSFVLYKFVNAKTSQRCHAVAQLVEVIVWNFSLT
jgi:hypothetical protein